VSESAQPQSVLEPLLRPGRYPRAGAEAPILVVQERRNVAQVQILARKGQRAALAQGVSALLGIDAPLAPLAGAEAEGVFVCATGPQEYWVFSETHGALSLEPRLVEALGETASLFDQSHARFVVRLGGPAAFRLLAKGTPLDLEAGAVPGQGASHTAIAHIPALVVRRARPLCTDLSVARSYAGSFMAWLAEAALEIGYTVESPAV